MSPRARQIAGLGAIVVGLAAIVAVGVLFWNEWAALLVVLGCVVVATWAAWYVLSRHGVVRFIAAIVLVGAAATAVVVLIREHSIWRIAIVLVFGLGAAALARVALGAGRGQLRVVAPPGVHVGAATRPVLIANPKSGGGKANESFLAEARARGIETLVLRPGDDLEELARGAVAGGADVLGMAGGDGSQALVATIAAEHDLPFVCIPAGTRNHFALDLGIDRDDVVGALDAFVDGYERRVDLATVNGRVFVNNVSLGLYAAIVQSEEYRDAKVGTAAKMLPDILGNDYSQFDFEIEGAAGTDRSNPDLILVSNNRYLLTGVGGFGTRERLDEGVIGVTAISLSSASDLAKFVALETAGRASSFSGWREWTEPSIVIRSSKPIDAGVDGEALTFDSPLRFEIRPGALRVRIAPHHPGVSPAAIVEQFTAAVLVDSCELPSAAMPADGSAPLPVAGIARWVPGIGAARSYQRRWIRFDLVAGVVLAAILVPQGMAYAELAGLPPVTGLYTTIVCLVGYALIGPSRALVLGPDSSVSPLIFAAIAPLVIATDDPATAIALAGMMAMMVGLIMIGLGVARLGFVADLLSKEVQVGYMNGLAIVIIVGQLPKLCGFSTDADSFIDEVRAFVDGFDQRNATALVLGLVTLAVLLLLPRVTKTIPAVLVAVVGATAVTAVFQLDVTTVGALPKGLPRPALPWTSFSDVGPLLVAAIGITLVSLTDTIATSSSFAARRGDEVDPNQEMMGIGAANLAAGVFQGFAVSTSGSRTAVAEQSGAKSQLTGLVGASVVVLLLLFFSSLLADLPQTALAAVVIAAALSLADLRALRRYREVRPSSLALSLVATAGVVFFGVLEGILVAVVLSVLLFFRRSWWPHGEVLGHVEGEEHWHSVSAVPSAVQLPEVLVYRWEAPLFFANANLFRRQIRHLIRQQDSRWVVIQCEAITDIDVTAAEMLEQLDEELNTQGVHLAFVELRSRLQDLVSRYGLFATLDRDHFYPTMREALAAIDEAGDGAAST